MLILNNGNDISTLDVLSIFSTLRACAVCCAQVPDNGWGSVADAEDS